MKWDPYNRRIWGLRLFASCLLAGALLYFLAGDVLSGVVGWILFTLCGAGMVGGVVLFLLFWRCPHCGMGLPSVGINKDVTVCPYCGADLLKEHLEKSRKR